MARHRPPHPAGEAHHRPAAAAQGADAVQRAGDACAVVTAELTHAGCCSIKFLAGNLQAKQAQHMQQARRSPGEARRARCRLSTAA